MVCYLLITIAEPSLRWITNAQAAERMVLLARTTPLEELDSSNKTRGLSVFYVDLARGKKEGSVVVRPIHKMGGRSVDANEVYIYHRIVEV